jgi:PPK2 family polyphosphate:nucleotide phosphotransferase
MNPRDTHIIKPGSKVKLSDIDPSKTPALSGSKAEERAEAERLHAENTEANYQFQRNLWAEDKRSLLVVLQGMDCGGKDGTIRHVFGQLNPQGCRVAGFKKPTSEELDHDFLWRVHKVTPRRGEITIFNRSHYEDVLAVRVLDLIPKDQWELRYDHINDFERTLYENGTRIIKIMLHISKDEQKERLQARLDDETRAWKFSLGDLDTRKLWPEYTKAYEAVLERCSTDHAPWYVVPADKKWYRNWVISSIVRQEFEKMDPEPPPMPEELRGVKVE